MKGTLVRMFLGNTLESSLIVSPLSGQKCAKSQYAHFVIAPGIAVAVSITVFFSVFGYEDWLRRTECSEVFPPKIHHPSAPDNAQKIRNPQSNDYVIWVVLIAQSDADLVIWGRADWADREYHTLMWCIKVRTCGFRCKWLTEWGHGCTLL